MKMSLQATHSGRPEMAGRGTDGKFPAFCRRIAGMEGNPPFIFYVGESAEELEELVKVMRDKLAKTYGSCDEVHLSGLDNDVSAWHAEMMTMPMFPSGRLILIRHAEALLKRIEGQAKVLANYLRDTTVAPEFTVSILQFKEKKLGKKIQVLEELALVYEDVPLGPEEIVAQIADRAAALGYKIARETIELIVEKSAAQQKTAFANFDRLLTFRLHEKEIRNEDVEEVVGQSESNLHFRLIDETARRNIAECLRILEVHALDEAELLVAALIRLFSEALRHHYYRASGMETGEIGQIIAARPLTGYPLKKSAERWSILVQKYSPQGIQLIMDALLKADQLCKEIRDTTQQQVILTSFYLMLSRAA
ncbi:MAG: hypothetical protein J0L53_13390 [Spirochaetes bacterium]|nr:hypothetical protein [Spirochaetota bacterium]